MKKIFLILLLLLPSLAWGTGYGETDSSWATPVIYEHSVQCSTVVLFISTDAFTGDSLWPNSWNIVDSVDMTPTITADSTIWRYGASFNVGGVAMVRFKCYEGDDAASTGIHEAGGVMNFKKYPLENNTNVLALNDFDPSADIVTVADTTENNFDLTSLSLEASLFDPATDIVTIADTTESNFDITGITATIPDSLFDKIDSLLTSVGWNIPEISLQDKLGAFGILDRASRDSTVAVYIDQIKDMADSIDAKLGPLGVQATGSGAYSLYEILTTTGAVADTVLRQGSGAGGVTAEQVKDAVWGQSADSAFAAGSMGDSAKYWGRSGSLSGSGANTVNVYIYDADTNGIFPNMVHLQTSGGGSDYYDETDSDGLSVFALANGTYLAWGSANGYSQTTVPDTVVVSSATTDTVYMAANTISAPNLPDRCTAYIYTYDITTDTTENAILEVTVANGPGPWIAADDSSAIMIPKKITATTDTSGKAEIVLWQSAEVVNADDITETIKYNFTLRKSNLFNWKATDRTVPSDSIWQIK